jgi:hypothetical protein
MVGPRRWRVPVRATAKRSEKYIQSIWVSGRVAVVEELFAAPSVAHPV